MDEFLGALVNIIPPEKQMLATGVFMVLWVVSEVLGSSEKFKSSSVFQLVIGVVVKVKDILLKKQVK